MSKNPFTGTATQPQRKRKFCQFNKDQYCTSSVCFKINGVKSTFYCHGVRLNACLQLQNGYGMWLVLHALYNKCWLLRLSIH